MKLRLSQFSHIIHNPATVDIVALWQALTMELFFVDKGLSEKLSHMKNNSLEHDILREDFPGSTAEQDAAMNHLLNARILVPATEDDSEYPLLLAQAMEETRFIGVLYLMLFDGCNFSCQYCFEDVHEPNKFRPKKMTKTVAKAGLELFAHLSTTYPPPTGHDPKIQLYGGEPTLNWDVFAFSVNYLNELKAKKRIDSRVGLATVTNGTNMTKDRADFIARNDVSVGVSIDGPRALNNLYRKTKSGRDPFDIAINAVKALREAGAKVGVSVTLTPDVVQNFSEVMTFLRSEVGVDRGLGFNILHHTKNLPVSTQYYEKAASCIIDAFQTFRESGIWEDRVMRKVVSFVDQHPLHADCAAIGHQIVVSPEGSIGICQDYIKDRTGFQSNVFDINYDPFADDSFLEWSRRTPFRMKECYSCPALGICGGGCPASAEAETGSIWNIDKRICAHSIQTLNFLIWDTYSQGHGMN